MNKIYINFHICHILIMITGNQSANRVSRRTTTWSTSSTARTAARRGWAYGHQPSKDLCHQLPSWDHPCWASWSEICWFTVPQWATNSSWHGAGQRAAASQLQLPANVSADPAPHTSVDRTKTARPTYTCDLELLSVQADEVSTHSAPQAIENWLHCTYMYICKRVKYKILII